MDPQNRRNSSKRDAQKFPRNSRNLVNVSRHDFDFSSIGHFRGIKYSIQCTHDSCLRRPTSFTPTICTDLLPDETAGIQNCLRRGANSCPLSRTKNYTMQGIVYTLAKKRDVRMKIGSRDVKPDRSPLSSYFAAHRWNSIHLCQIGNTATTPAAFYSLVGFLSFRFVSFQVGTRRSLSSRRVREADYSANNVLCS